MAAHAGTALVDCRKRRTATTTRHGPGSPAYARAESIHVASYPAATSSFCFVWGEGGEEFADLGRQAFDGSLSGLAQESLSLAKASHGIEADCRRKIKKPSASDFDRTADARALVRSEVVHDDDVSGLEFRNEDLIDIGLKRQAVDGRTRTMGAVIPVSRSVPTKVVVFEWPMGTLIRSPGGVAPAHTGEPCWSRPRSRRRARRSGSRTSCPSNESSRCFTMSGRSCPRRAVFFRVILWRSRSRQSAR